MGRPRARIDWDIVSELCELMCTEEEIATILGVCVDTLAKRCQSDQGMTFPEFFKKNNTRARRALREAQFKVALEGHNPTMLIWLGKQYLGQRNHPNRVAHEPIKLGYSPVKICELQDVC